MDCVFVANGEVTILTPQDYVLWEKSIDETINELPLFRDKAGNYSIRLPITQVYYARNMEIAENNRDMIIEQILTERDALRLIEAGVEFKNE